MEGRPCRMRVLAGAGVWGTGTVVTHTGLGWMGGLVLRMVLAFNVAELGRTSGEKEQMSFTFRRHDLMHVKRTTHTWKYTGFNHCYRFLCRRHSLLSLSGQMH